MILAINNLTKSEIDLAPVKRLAVAFAREYKIGGRAELSVALIGDAAMKRLNRVWRGQNRPTDILSFAGEGDELGELIMDYAQIRRQAGRFGQSASRELALVFVHGLLHLKGYDDQTEAGRKRMIALAEKLVKNNFK